METPRRIKLINQIKALAMELSKECESNIQVVIDVSPEKDSIKCKLTEFDL